MKLLDVTFRDSVNEPGSATPQLYVVAGKFALDFADGFVKLSSKDCERLVPLSNVRFMTPAPAAPKAGK